MKNKGFTLIELMVVVCIIAMLLAIALPAMQAIINKAKGIESPDDIMAKAQIVQIEGTSVAVTADEAVKIELKPAFNGAGVKIFLSTLPENSEIIQENGKTYLYWIPLKAGEHITTNIITSAGELKETKEIKLMVR